jgi:hypothetical protein
VEVEDGNRQSHQENPIKIYSFVLKWSYFETGCGIVFRVKKVVWNDGSHYPHTNLESDMTDLRWRTNMRIRCKFKNCYLKMKTLLKPLSNLWRKCSKPKLLTFTIEIVQHPRFLVPTESCTGCLLKSHQDMVICFCIKTMKQFPIKMRPPKELDYSSPSMYVFLTSDDFI